MSNDPCTALTTRAQDPRPFITWYHQSSGRRTELSGRSFANWVNKTVWLLADLGADSGDIIALPLLGRRPAHWVSLIWVMACWQAGCTPWLPRGVGHVLPDGEAITPGAVVLGPDDLPNAHSWSEEGPTVACSLHPLGRPTGNLPDWLDDYADVLSQPDAYVRKPMPNLQPIWISDVKWLTNEAWDAVQPRNDRVLLTPPVDDVSRFLLKALVAPLSGGGSVVLAEPASDDADLWLTEISTAEDAVRD